MFWSGWTIHSFFFFFFLTTVDLFDLSQLIGKLFSYSNFILSDFLISSFWMFKLKVWNHHLCPLLLNQSNLTPRPLNGREPKAAVNAYIRKIHASASCWRREINPE